MAINVNTVYTTVLSILNKEQRGYITPFEFDQLATQVQLELFEKFFEDYNQYLRMPRTNVEFASRIEHIRNEFQVFQTNNSASSHTTNTYSQPVDLHRFGSVNYNKGFNSPEIEIVSDRDYTEQTLSPLTTPTSDFPIAKYKQDKITVFPPVTSTYTNSDVTFNYIRKPANPVWGYSVGSLGQYVYVPGTSQNFEISDTQQTEVILEILKYSGIIIRDPSIIQMASQELQQEEVNTKR
tara:strand:- start:20 stop:733 length:714 start_codon:yes stop_codon:yes gene_type:complete